MADISKVAVGNTEYDIKDTTARSLATTSSAGLVKPDGSTITVDNDGTIHSSGSGSGGHTIVNAAGTDMNAEDKLQFATMQVTDDSTNGKTVVRHVVDVTQEQYDLLPSSKNSDNIIYHITDEDANAIQANGVSYSNTTSGATATDVQAAVDESFSHIANKADKTDLASISQAKADGCTEINGIAKGIFFYLDGDLVRAKANIANGASFNLGTNYEEVTDGGLNNVKHRGIVFTSQVINANSANRISFVHNLGSENFVVALASDANIQIAFDNRTTTSVEIIVQNTTQSQITCDVSVGIFRIE